MKEEMEKLAEALELVDSYDSLTFEPDAVAGMLRMLLEGESADTIIGEFDFGWRDDEGV